MQAIDQPFMKIINGTTQFVIPVFQRDYSWTEDQCERLWTDVITVGLDEGDRKHFLGSVVYIASGDSSASFTRWLLIDGQQRLTTLTLLVVALRDHLVETGWVPPGEDGPTVKRLDAYFLRNVQEEGSREHKLVLRREDQAALQELLNGRSGSTDSTSKIVENYQFFREQIATADPAGVYAGIGRLVVVDVKLDRAHDDPQMIFESLNSTGVDLTQADLIRNYILMRLPEKEQTRLYEELWRPIEALFRGAGKTFDSFARDYMALHTQAKKQARADAIYEDFRKFFDGRLEAVGLQKSLEEMLRFARYHSAFSLGRDAPAQVAAPLSRLSRLAEVAAILVMRLSDAYHRPKTLDADAFRECLVLLESFLFRRAVCGMQSRGYWQVFSSIAYRIDDNEPLTSLKVALFRLRDSYRFPRDDEFQRDLAARDIYGMRTCHYLLERLENDGNKEASDASSYTVEHVMPQNENLSSEWKAMLGPNWESTQQEWLHRLGNLTLTGYNSTYSDRPFEDKKTIDGGFSDSSVRLNRFVREQSAWNAETMDRRGQKLAEQALGIWPRLSVSEDAVAAAKRRDLLERAKRRDASEVPMSATARSLVESLRPKLKSLGDDVVEMAEPRSISYHSADFFLEVLPRKHRVLLLFNLDFSECEDVHDELSDAADYKFWIHAKYSGGTYMNVYDPAKLDAALRIARRAYELARA